jgi:RNA polymerase sigma-70 factor (ECF subfamily)
MDRLLNAMLLLTEQVGAARNEEPKAVASRQSDTELEAIILQRCRSGDWSEFGWIIQRYQRLVWSAVDGVTDDKEAVPDLIQEAFIRVYEKLHTFKYKSSFSSWLFRLARNHALSYLRRIQRRPRVASIDEHPRMTIERNTAGPPDCPPEEQYLNEAQYLALEEMLVRLPEKQRMAINLHYSGEYTYEEISRILGAPLNTVRTWLRRGREQLLRMAAEGGWQ